MKPSKPTCDVWKQNLNIYTHTQENILYTYSHLFTFVVNSNNTIIDLTTFKLIITDNDNNCTLLCVTTDDDGRKQVAIKQAICKVLNEVVLYLNTSSKFLELYKNALFLSISLFPYSSNIIGKKFMRVPSFS